MLVRIRNNSESLRTLPAVGDLNGKIEGPTDRINLMPGEVVLIDDKRLSLYDSPAFSAAFEERNDGRKPDLEILGAEREPVSVAARLSELTAQGAPQGAQGVTAQGAPQGAQGVTAQGQQPVAPVDPVTAVQ